VDAASPIVAAGAVVWRRSQDDEIELALIHRSRHQDWSFPKGKLENNESLISCAYREVQEETGCNVRFGPCLGEISYQVDQQEKKVTYWSAKLLSVDGTPSPDEVDEVRWVKVHEAKLLITRETDLEVLRRFGELDLDTKPLILLRHAKAIERTEWAGEDTDRPLSSVGERQSKRLLSVFQPFGVEEIHSSSAVRCYETITPIARSLNIDFFFTDSLSEDVHHKDKNRPVKYIERLLVNNYPILICSHNPVLPNVVSGFVEKFGVEINQTRLEPGDSWIVHHIDREVVAIDFVPGPNI
jgi:8-oxo-dGTP pyrophosphatase MutT (NUDIX family)/phosphohistidine phosphatase SixA